MALTRIAGPELAAALRAHFPNAVTDVDAQWVWVDKDQLLNVVQWLKESPDWAMDFPEMITASDYIDYLEMVYVLTSFTLHRQVCFKVRLYDRAKTQIASLMPLYIGADLQESETYDLFGIEFVGHPHLRRIFMWEGFPGWPLRKDFTDFDHRLIQESSK